MPDKYDTGPLLSVCQNEHGPHTHVEHLEESCHDVPCLCTPRVYVAVDALLSDDVIARADRLVPAHSIEHPHTVALVARALIDAVTGEHHA